MAAPEHILTINTPAKINLALAVSAPEASGEKRGFHRIASWFVCTSLCDTLALRALDSHSTSRHSVTWAHDAPRTSPIDWPVEKDLAVRAHRLLEHTVGRALPLEMTLTKRVPVGGGLGGGSSDAAAALIGIDRLLDLRLGMPALRTLSQCLGSDIAFFMDDDGVDERHDSPSSARVHLRPRPALVTGFGETIERLPRRALPPALLLAPAFGCPTGPVYKAFDALLAQASSGPPAREDSVRQAMRVWTSTGAVDERLLCNGLTPAACRVEPRLQQALHRLVDALRVPVHVTGSGSTMFIVGGGSRDLGAIARDVARIDPTISVIPVELA